MLLVLSSRVLLLAALIILSEIELFYKLAT